MSGGGRSGSTTTEVKVPEYVEEAARRNLNKAEAIAQIGYTPYYGPDVAAFTPMQEAAFQNTADAASAFGMSGGNMSAQNLRGGMAAPTSYAGGARGYSSAPMYEDALAQLLKKRPGQKKYIDSFFIDPVTGEPGSNMQPRIDYTQSPAMALAAGDGDGVNSDGKGVVAGRGGGLFNYRQGPNLNGRAGYGIGGYTHPRDTIDGGGAGQSKVICTALHELGRLSDEVYALDEQFGLRVNREDPMLGDGYRLWATSVANYIKGDTLGSKAALAIVAPIATAWAAEMAHVMRPDEYKSNFAGKSLMAVGHPLCRMIGRVFLSQVNKEAV